MDDMATRDILITAGRHDTKQNSQNSQKVTICSIRRCIDCESATSRGTITSEFWKTIKCEVTHVDFPERESCAPPGSQ